MPIARRWACPCPSPKNSRCMRRPGRRVKAPGSQERQRIEIADMPAMLRNPPGPRCSNGLPAADQRHHRGIWIGLKP